jgi:integrase
MTRRANGEGTAITQGADGRWHASLSFGVKPGGRRDRRHVSGTTRADCARKLRALQAKRDAGLVPGDGRPPSVEQWLAHWLDTIAAAKVRPRTLDDYRSRARHHLIPAIGHHRLDRLQPEHVERLTKDLQDRGLAPATALKSFRVLSRALHVAYQRGRVARNVCTLVDAPSVRHVEVEPFDAEDARRLLAAADGARNSARWSVALALGLRQGEALGLRWRDVDLDAGTLTVRSALQRQTYRHGCGDTCGRTRAGSCPQRVGGGLVVVDPKSQAGRRTIALPTPLIAAFRVHRAAQGAERLAAGPLWIDGDYVFAQLNGKPIDPRQDWGAWKRLCDDAGVRPARLHDARHTAATLLLQHGVAPRVAMQVLGHSQISLTLGTYSHVIPELATDAAEKMGTALWG